MLSGKSTIVTGSTSGIGLGIARGLAANGVNVMLNGFGDMREIEAVREEIANGHNIKVLYNGANVTVPREIESMMDAAQDEFGVVDILVNNAGIQYVAPIEEFPVEKWDAIIAINLSSAFHTTRLAIPKMKQRGWGRIVNMASSTLGSVVTGFVHYMSSKAGIVGFTRAMASELGAYGITVNAISPGLTRSPGTLARKPRPGMADMEAEFNFAAGMQAIKRVEVPEDLVGTVSYLTSDDAAFITGQTLNVDGGRVRS